MSRRKYPKSRVMKRKTPDKHCAVCGELYHRRNLTEAWVQRNPGSREGWLKKVSKVCLNCCSAKQSQRTINVATLEPVGSNLIVSPKSNVVGRKGGK